MHAKVHRATSVGFLGGRSLCTRQGFQRKLGASWAQAGRKHLPRETIIHGGPPEESTGHTRDTCDNRNGNGIITVRLMLLLIIILIVIMIVSVIVGMMMTVS